MIRQTEELIPAYNYIKSKRTIWWKIDNFLSLGYISTEFEIFYNDSKISLLTKNSYILERDIQTIKRRIDENKKEIARLHAAHVAKWGHMLFEWLLWKNEPQIWA